MRGEWRERCNQHGKARYPDPAHVSASQRRDVAMRRMRGNPKAEQTQNVMVAVTVEV